MRSSTWLRNGSERPRNTSAPMMMMKGTAFDHPGCLNRSGSHLAFVSVSSASMTPMSTPPSRVSGNDVNPPTSAAASAGMSSNSTWLTDSPMIGTTRMPATPASAAPAAQLTVAIRSGERPSEAAASWFSAAARVASPKRVYL